MRVDIRNKKIEDGYEASMKKKKEKIEINYLGFNNSNTVDSSLFINNFG